ncbi:hypothetical protein Tco_0671670 [Tanacetum coccineum]
MGSTSTSTTPIVEKIIKIERLILDRKFTLVDDEGKHLENVDSSGDHDGEDEVKVVDTNSLLEQWKETYENADYDYDPYDNDMYEG